MTPNLVFITESNSLARKALRDLVSEVSLTCVREASDSANLLSLIAAGADLLLLDLDMSYLSTELEIIDRLKTSYPSLKIAVLSNKVNKLLLIYRFTRIEGCILKNDPYDEIKKAVKAVSQGHEYCSSKILKIMQEAALRKKPQLSRREAEVFFLAARCSDHEIARQLHISINTVRAHISQIKLKLSIKERRELILLAL